VAAFTTPPLNRNVAELLKMIELGLQSRGEYAQYISSKYGSAVSLDYVRKTVQLGEQDALKDRQRLETFKYRKQLTSSEQQSLDEMKQRWRTAMAQTLLMGKDSERELIDYMDENPGEFLARGGRAERTGGKLARSDTVPAMLTPGEYVVRKDVVNRLGVGLFESLNNLSVPKDQLRQRLSGVSKSQDGPSVTGFARGGLVHVRQAGKAAANLASNATNVLRQILPDADMASAVARQLAAVTSGMASRAPGISAPQMVIVAAQNTPGSTTRTSESVNANQRTIRVELSSGGQQVTAQIDARDESRLLDLLKQARSRTG
jgi:hypothetical protein